eukprot:scaffold17828_cov66-Phaeocystis_antarctica.AAC.1
MRCRPSASGCGTSTCTSSRPGRSSAGSISSGRLVMPMTRMLSSCSTPSILASNWLTTESRMPDVSPVSEPRSRVNASISSNTITCSAESSPASACSTSASAKSERMNCSETVYNLGLARTHGARDFAREQRLAAAGRTVEQHASHGLDSEGPRQRRRVEPRGENSADDLVEGVVQPTDTLADALRELELGARLATRAIELSLPRQCLLTWPVQQQ